KLIQKGGDKMADAVALADARGIARNPSLSTINEERSSQISVYESAVSEASGEDEAVSVSIDGREVSLSLYETPDISEAEAKQIAEIYADEISDHLSAHDNNQAALPPLRFTRETSRKGPLIMEAMVIDVENEAFDEYMSMADIVYDDARTEADVEELSAMEAVMVEEREALRTDIADLPDMEVWEEEHLSTHTVSVDGKAVARVSEQNVLQHDLRSLSEQGMSLLKEQGKETRVLGKGEAVGIEEQQVISAAAKSLITEKAHQTMAEAQQEPGLNIAQAEEQAVLTGAEKMKSEKVERKQAKRSIETREVAVAEEQQFLSEGGTLSDLTNLSKIVERYPSLVTQEAVAVTSPEAVEQAKSMESEERPSKKAKKASVKKTQVKGEAAVVESAEVYEGEAKLISEQQVTAQKAKAVISEQKGYKVTSAEVMEDVAFLETDTANLRQAQVKDATQHEALMMEQAEVVSGQAPKSLKVKKAKTQKATVGQVSAAGVAQQQEQEYYTAPQDIPEYFQAEETEADFSELHSMLEPMQQAEQYGYEHAAFFEGLTPEQQLAIQLDPSYREAVEVAIRQGYSQAGDLTLMTGQETQAFAHQTLHEAVEGYEQMGLSGDIRDMADYMRAMSDRAQVLTDTTREAVMIQEADVDYANLNVFNKEDMSHMLTVAEERSGSLAECIVVQEADLQSEAAIVSQRPAAQPERAVAGIVEGAAESVTVGEPPVVAEMDTSKGVVQKTGEAREKKRSAAESAAEDEKVMAASKGESVIITHMDEAVAKKAKIEKTTEDGEAKDIKDTAELATKSLNVKN
ncbi:protein lava lamp-like, partial [Homarus americanus]|uniref:protein lava lamp-like n=1 Tax=Homarus americanus TaxID=6706 RepID=UPI001C43DAD2